MRVERNTSETRLTVSNIVWVIYSIVITKNRREKTMSHGFTDLGTAMQEVLKRAQAMSKQYEKQNSQEEPSTVECKDCSDTGMIIESKEVEYYGYVIEKDLDRKSTRLNS